MPTKEVMTFDQQLGLFKKPKPPLILERNQHGHILLSITGIDLLGAAEIERLEASMYVLCNPCKWSLLSTGADSYDKNHRLVDGEVYQIALMPSEEIPCESDRTTENLRKRGMEHYGYGKPLAGIMPRVRELLSDDQITDMCAYAIIALHDPISGMGLDDPRVLCIDVDEDEDDEFLFGYPCSPEKYWGGPREALFVFPVLASGSS